MPAPYHSYTYHEYLALEESANVKHEFFNGEIYAMAGGTPEHAALAMPIGSSLFAALKAPGCKPFHRWGRATSWIGAAFGVALRPRASA